MSQDYLNLCATLRQSRLPVEDSFFSLFPQSVKPGDVPNVILSNYVLNVRHRAFSGTWDVIVGASECFPYFDLPLSHSYRLATFETLNTILTIENLNSCQSHMWHLNHLKKRERRWKCERFQNKIPWKAKYKIQNTEYKIQDTKYKIQNTKYKIQNTKYLHRRIASLCTFSSSRNLLIRDIPKHDFRNLS